MTYRIEISRRAAKAVTGLDKPLRRRVLAAIEALVAKDKGAANYHLAWFLACNTAVAESVSP